ncbi:Ig-like domain-containing protein, partial [Acinetobacter junii]|uniref:Ig-like domain-containing protein n=2 Tax=Acinetobacter TaxID=469 RepID=UPI003AF892E8
MAPTSYADNVGDIQNPASTAVTTDDRTPGLNIGGGLTDTPTLYVDGVAVDAVYDPLTGTLTPTEPLSPGEHQLSYTLTDAAGNESAQSPALTLTVDTTAPTLTITSSDLELGAGETSTITFQFSEDVAGFTASDVVVAGGTLSNFVQVDANTWTATFTQSGTAAPSISVANGAYSDVAGNAGVGDVLDGTDGFIFNPTASDLIGAITIPEDLNGDGIINAEELGTDGVFEAQVALGSDAVVGNVITVNGTPYTVKQADIDAGFITATIAVTADGEIAIRAEARDAAGNVDVADTTVQVITVDTTAPATPVAPTSYADNVGDIQNPASTAVTTDDRTPGLNIGGGLTDTPTLYVDGVAVDAVYDPLTGTLTPTEPLSPGEHQLSYTLTDAAGNESAQSPALTLTVDTTAPTLTITSSDLELGAGETSTITFQFSEDVAGFTASDVVVAGGTLSNFVQVDANTWTATFTQSGTAAPSISVANGAYSDVAGNAGVGDVLDGTDGFIFNPTASDLIGAITIPEDLNGDGIINAEELGTDGVFEAQVALGSDAVVGNVITVNGTPYTVTQADLDAGFITAPISVTADGALTITATATDAQGNVDSSNLSVTVDTSAVDLIGAI